MIFLAASAIVGSTFLISRVRTNDVQIVVHKTNGLEQVINTRKFRIPDTYSEIQSISVDGLEWLPLFTYDKKHSLILLVDPIQFRKINGTWMVDVKYSMLQVNGKTVKAGTFSSVPFYGDQLFGIDDRGKATFVRVEGEDKFKVWSDKKIRHGNSRSLPASLRRIISIQLVSKSIPKWPGWKLSEIRVRGELVPQNERWRSVIWSSPPQSQSDLRTSISDVWGSAISWFPKKYYFANGASDAEGLLAQKMYLVQACKFPIALGSTMKSIGPTDVRFDLSQLKESELYRLNVSSHTQEKLCNGVLGIQI